MAGGLPITALGWLRPAGLDEPSLGKGGQRRVEATCRRHMKKKGTSGRREWRRGVGDGAEPGERFVKVTRERSLLEAESLSPRLAWS